ncbi:MAG: hypothetical protein QM706_14370 [Nitrospira sp.]
MPGIFDNRFVECSYAERAIYMGIEDGDPIKQVNAASLPAASVTPKAPDAAPPSAG